MFGRFNLKSSNTSSIRKINFHSGEHRYLVMRSDILDTWGRGGEEAKMQEVNAVKMVQ